MKAWSFGCTNVLNEMNSTLLTMLYLASSVSPSSVFQYRREPSILPPLPRADSAEKEQPWLTTWGQEMNAALSWLLKAENMKGDTLMHLTSWLFDTTCWDLPHNINTEKLTFSRRFTMTVVTTVTKPVSLILSLCHRGSWSHTGPVHTGTPPAVRSAALSCYHSAPCHITASCPAYLPICPLFRPITRQPQRPQPLSAPWIFHFWRLTCFAPQKEHKGTKQHA